MLRDGSMVGIVGGRRVSLAKSSTYFAAMAASAAATESTPDIRVSNPMMTPGRGTDATETSEYGIGKTTKTMCHLNDVVLVVSHNKSLICIETSEYSTGKTTKALLYLNGRKQTMPLYY